MIREPSIMKPLVQGKSHYCLGNYIQLNQGQSRGHLANEICVYTTAWHGVIFHNLDQVIIINRGGPQISDIKVHVFNIVNVVKSDLITLIFFNMLLQCNLWLCFIHTQWEYCILSDSVSISTFISLHAHHRIRITMDLVQLKWHHTEVKRLCLLNYMEGPPCFFVFCFFVFFVFFL